MRKGGGKAKGSAFERKIAKYIVRAFKGFGITQRDCWRSVNSGGHEIAWGDLELSPKLEELFPYVVECKFRRKIKWQHFLERKPKSEEMNWIAQVLQDVNRANRSLIPLLVMKENFGPIYVAIPADVSAKRVIEICKWTTFIKNVVRECTSHKGKPRGSKRSLSASRP